MGYCSEALWEQLAEYEASLSDWEWAAYMPPYIPFTGWERDELLESWSDVHRERADSDYWDAWEAQWFGWESA